MNGQNKLELFFIILALLNLTCNRPENKKDIKKPEFCITESCGYQSKKSNLSLEDAIKGSSVIVVNDAEKLSYLKDIIKSGGPVIVNFSSWKYCRVCRDLTPEFANLSKEYSIPFIYFDGDKLFAPKFFEYLKKNNILNKEIEKISPIVMVFKNNKIKKIYYGFYKRKTIEDYKTTLSKIGFEIYF